MGIAIRKGLTGLIFTKSLRLSLAALNEATPGKLINLSSGDMSLIESNMVWLPRFLMAPACILLILALLYETVGIAALYGLLVCVILFLIQFPINFLVLRLRLRIAETTDTRINIIQNIIQGIQTIKSYAWEGPLTSRANSARIQEIAKFKRYYFLSGFFDSLLAYSDPLLSLPLLLAPVLSYVPFDASSVLIGLCLMG